MMAVSHTKGGLVSLPIVLIIAAFVLYSHSFWGFLRGEKSVHSVTFFLGFIADWIASARMGLGNADNITLHSVLGMTGFLFMALLAAIVFIRGVKLSVEVRRRHALWPGVLISFYAVWVTGFVVGIWSAAHRLLVR